MDNKLKSKTRLAAIQLVSQHLVNDQDIESIKDDFDMHYRNTVIDNNSEKIQYNVNFLSKLVVYFKTINLQNISKEINGLIKFDRELGGAMSFKVDGKVIGRLNAKGELVDLKKPVNESSYVDLQRKYNSANLYSINKYR